MHFLAVSLSRGIQSSVSRDFAFETELNCRDAEKCSMDCFMGNIGTQLIRLTMTQNFMPQVHSCHDIKMS